MQPPADRSAADTPIFRSENVNPNLGLLLGGQLISQVGDKFHLLAVAFLVLETTGSPARMGLVLFCSVFPGMVLGIVTGAVVDRCGRKTVIVAADAARGVIVALLWAVYLFDALSFGLLVAAQLLISIATAFFDPAVPAMIPQIVKRTDLARANAQTQLVGGIATILGPTLGGLLVATIGMAPVFALNAASYLLSAVVELFIRLPARPVAAVEKPRLAADIAAGCRYVASRRPLAVILVMVGAIHFFFGSVEVVIPVLATGLEGGGAANIGFVQTALGIGSVLAALAISVRSIQGRETLLLFGGVFCLGLLMAAAGSVAWTDTRLLAPFLPLFAAIGAGVIVAGTSFRSLLQQTVDEAMLGRVFGFVSAIGNLTIPMAILVFGALLESVDPALVLIGGGLALLPVSWAAHAIYTARAGRHRAGTPPAAKERTVATDRATG
jgi:DHA3 family macrolide efflux protein-like MFS transporter